MSSTADPTPAIPSANIERRFNAIIAAHLDAIGEVDPHGIMLGDIFLAVRAAVLGVTHAEIIAALNWRADRCIEQAKMMMLCAGGAGPDEWINNCLVAIINAPDRAALAIAYQAGYAAQSAGKQIDEAPDFYTTHDRISKAGAWLQGHVASEATQKFAEKLAKDRVRRALRAGLLMPLISGCYQLAEDYKPEIDGPAVPLATALRALRKSR
jgi:hypothetical protein